MLAAERPDFVLVSVPREVAPVTTAELVRRGVPVLTETPPVPGAAGRRELWAAVPGGPVAVAEQYPLLPGHTARAVVARSGAIGEVTSVQASSTHDHHGASTAEL